MPIKEVKETKVEEIKSAVDSRTKRFVELEGDDEFEDFPVECKFF